MGEAPRSRTNGSGGTGNGNDPPPAVTPEIVDIQLDARIRGEIDMMVATARAYPRNLQQARELALQLATLDDETAASCYYSLARRDRESGENKPIEGPSVRLAEILAHSWQNLFVDGRQVAQDLRFVTARGGAWDLQSNVRWTFEVTRRITTRQGRTYNDDMIATTATAASSIAVRNAVFKAVPSPFWRPIYLKCRELAMGQPKDLQENIKKALAVFAALQVTEGHILALLSVTDVKHITREHVGTLRGLYTAIRDGETTVEAAFGDLKIVSMPERQSTQAPPGPGPSPSLGTPPSHPTVGASSSGSSSSGLPPSDSNGGVSSGQAGAGGEGPAPDLVITSCQKRENSQHQAYWWTEFSGGRPAAITFSHSMGAKLEEWFLAKRPIADILTHVKGNFTYLDEVTAVPTGEVAHS